MKPVLKNKYFEARFEKQFKVYRNLNQIKNEELLLM